MTFKTPEGYEHTVESSQEVVEFLFDACFHAHLFEQFYYSTEPRVAYNDSVGTINRAIKQVLYAKPERVRAGDLDPISRPWGTNAS